MTTRDSGTQSPTRTPIWSVLVFTFLGSLGTGAVTNGIFFLAEAAFGFDAKQNFLLAGWFGITYVFAALLVGPALERAITKTPWLHARFVLCGLTLTLAVLCFVPAIAAHLRGTPGEPPVWTIWVLAGVYAPLTGALWPIVESYLSGGRRAGVLRRSVGHFNVTWSAALIVAFFCMGPLLNSNPLAVLSGLGTVHAASICLLFAFGRDPQASPIIGDEPHPASYTRLLGVSRVLLPMSYVIISSLSPLLPSIEGRLGIPLAWGPPLAATWLIARTATFWVFSHWQGWHGRWWVPTVATIGLLSGFAIVVTSPLIGGGGSADLGVPMFLLGLAVIGVCQGVTYLLALYYALEVGNAEVHAGGMHEALIGVGYTLGPLCGYAAARTFHPTDARFEPLMIAIVLVVAALGCGVAIKRAVPRQQIPG